MAPGHPRCLLSHILKQHRVHPEAVYLTGYSMGVAGTWATAMDYPDRLAAIALLCGRVIPLLAGHLWRTPVWVFHKDKDEVVPFSQAKETVEVLQSRGNHQVKFIVLKGRWPRNLARSVRQLGSLLLVHGASPS